jgi:Protein of unknown function (DUF3616)
LHCYAGRRCTYHEGLQGDGRTYSAHTPFLLSDYLTLPVPPSSSSEEKTKIGEADIEGLAYHKGYPWLVGSHRPKRSKPEAESATKNFAHLARVSSDGNRYLLARIPPVKRKGIYTLAKEVEEHGQKRSAAQLRCSTTTSELTHALHEDVHLQHFFSLPGKDNSTAHAPPVSAGGALDLRRGEL